MGLAEVIFFWGGRGYDYVAYQIKADDACSKYGSKYFAHRHFLDPGKGSKGQTIYFFSESSLVAYHIKGNPAQSAMKANMLSLHTPTTPGVESKGHIFLFEKWSCCISN